jgi:alkanesulfonate monooxygenase SsuD/methylene tetrahydromethanopterin reductase-like flavin-dependent oxidoreductase (luciferase family)
MFERPLDGSKPTWAEIYAMAARAEELGFDTVWTADEIVWRVPDRPGPRGWWECLTMTGGVAASTTKVQVGTWVMSALHHNAGMVASAAETLDEISGGRFVLGLGAGHGGAGAQAFGYPADRTLCPSPASSIAPKPPRCRRTGPRPGRVPLMLGGHSPRTMDLAASSISTFPTSLHA